MKCLVTAGNTQVLIDKVRCITNIFSGKTGTQIALDLTQNGHEVVLLTSKPEVVNQLAVNQDLSNRLLVYPYQTFEELQSLMTEQITQGQFQAIVHSAAVSDYLSAGIYAPISGTTFNKKSLEWSSKHIPSMRDVSAGKVKSNHEELWLKFTRAPKLIDLIRREWGYHGKLVKFKLEVGVDESQLEKIAESSRLQSQADLMVANTLEGMNDWALVGPIHGNYLKVDRQQLSSRLAEWIAAP